MKDEKSAAKFRYINTVSGQVVAQSIAFRVVSIYWQGDDPIPLKSCLQVSYPLLKADGAPFPWYLNAKGPTSIGAPALHTLRLIAQQPWRHCVTSLRSAHWLASSLKLAARCHVSGCWPSCWVLEITYSQDATTDINTKYARRRRYAQACAFLSRTTKIWHLHPLFTLKPPFWGTI